MKTRIPIRNEYVQPRKASRLNIENLYATLLHLIQLTNPTNASIMTGFIGQIYNRMLFIYGLDPKEFIRLIKAVRKWYIEYLRGQNISWDPKDFSNWDEDLLCPTLLSGLFDVMKRLEVVKTPSEILFFKRILFTLLSVDRVVVLPANPDYSSITDTTSFSSDHKDYPSWLDIDAALQALGITKKAFSKVYKRECKDFEYELLSTKGPNGLQTWTAHLDARAWSTRPKVFSALRSFLDHSGLQRIYKDLLGCIKIDSKEIMNVGSPLLGKLAVLEEWGGKTRVVAEMDYWTQMALTPLHNTVNNFLKGILADGTFDQMKIAERVKLWTKDSKRVINSFDLTTATDVLPAKLQGDIIGRLLPASDIGVNWRDVLTQRMFLTPGGSYIQYAMGQPMGARSSFPMLALCHHVIVQVAAARAQISNFKDYVILGDDIVICNDLVATKYKVIMDALAVPINETKSVLHSAGFLPAAEICKRVFIAGEELSIFNAKEIVKTIKDGSLAPTLQNDLLRAGWDPSPEVFWTFMAAILDKDSLMTLIKLNLVPKELSGLLRTVTPNTKMTDLKQWYADIELEDNDLIELHTYVMATDQLKRLDSVLRAGSTLTDALGILAAHEQNPKAIPENVKNVWLNELLSAEEKVKMTAFLETLGTVHYGHPVLSAARAETNRISELLHSLNSFDSTMVTSARHGLLEACRSAAGSMWAFGETTRVQDMRALFHRTLTALNSMVTRGREMDASKRVFNLSYSVTLTSIGRLWNVYFSLGGRTSVNALRASVSRNVIEAQSTLDSALVGIVFDNATKNSTDSSTTPDTTSVSGGDANNKGDKITPTHVPSNQN